MREITVHLRAIGQELILNPPFLASKTVNITRLAFDLDEYWAGADKTALFWTALTEDHPIPARLDENDSCMVPADVITAPGFFVSLFAGWWEEDTKDLFRITTNAAFIPLNPSGFRPPAPPTPDVYTQILAALNKKEQASGKRFTLHKTVNLTRRKLSETLPFSEKVLLVIRMPQNLGGSYPITFGEGRKISETPMAERSVDTADGDTVLLLIDISEGIYRFETAATSYIAVSGITERQSFSDVVPHEGRVSIAEDIGIVSVHCDGYFPDLSSAEIYVIEKTVQTNRFDLNHHTLSVAKSAGVIINDYEKGFELEATAGIAANIVLPVTNPLSWTRRPYLVIEGDPSSTARLTVQLAWNNQTFFATVHSNAAPQQYGKQTLWNLAPYIPAHLNDQLWIYVYVTPTEDGGHVARFPSFYLSNAAPEVEA